MTDIVLTVPVCEGEEDRLFGRFLDRFIEAAAAALGAGGPDGGGDAPLVMVRSDPLPGGVLKHVIFQEPGTADAFSEGWSRARHDAF
jgi:hypothetical protein